MLNISLEKWDKAGSIDLIKEGHQIGAVDFLFQRIEDIDIDKQVQKTIGY